MSNNCSFQDRDQNQWLCTIIDSIVVSVASNSVNNIICTLFFFKVILYYILLKKKLLCIIKPTTIIQKISCAKARTHHSIVGIGHFFLFGFYCLPPFDGLQFNMFTFRYLPIVFWCVFFFIQSCFFCIQSNPNTNCAWSDRYDCVLTFMIINFMNFPMIKFTHSHFIIIQVFFSFLRFRFYSLENFLKIIDALRNSKTDKSELHSLTYDTFAYIDMGIRV